MNSRSSSICVDGRARQYDFVGARPSELREELRQ